MNPKNLSISFAFFVSLISFSPALATDLATVESYLDRGQTPSAEKALAPLLQESPNDPRLQTLQALIWVRYGKLAEAIALYSQALSLSSDPRDKLIILNNYLTALEYQRKFLAEQEIYLEKDNNHQELPKVKQHLNQLFQTQQQTRQQAVTLASKLTPDLPVVQAYLEAHQPEQAQKTLEALSPSPGKTPLWILLAQQSPNPIPILQQAKSEADTRGKIKVLTALAELDSKYLPEAIALAEAQQADDYLFRLYHLQAQQGINSRVALKSAINSLSRLRPQLASPHPQTTFLFQEQVIPVYRDYLAVLLENPSQSDLEEARRIFDRLQIAQVENLFNELCLTNEPRNLNETLTKNQSAIIDLIVLNDGYHILLTLPSGEIKHRKIPISALNLENRLLEWRRNLTDPLNLSYQEIATQMYDEILRPFESDLKGIKQLIFISDEGFRTIPPQAFYDNQKQQHLIEQFSVSQLLGLSFLSDSPISPRNLLAFGLSEARPPFNQPLPYIVPEIKAIAFLIPNSKTELNSNFTVDNLRQELLLKNPQFLHLATHAQFTGDPKTSLIATYNQTIDLFELKNLISLPNNLQLLVLSACETSQGNNLSTLGLVGVAAKGGIPHTLGTLWKADDQGIQELMTDFYENLSKGDSPSAALQKAQIKSINHQQHPRNWALMLLIGSY